MTSRSHALVAALLASAAACVFWLPALPAARGFFPAPLDDVYIHFDFARSLAAGHPFAWIPGQGYSSGETAPLYALVLAVPHVFTSRHEVVAAWAAFVTVACVAKLLSAVRTLAHPCPAWLSWLVALVPVSIGIVDWSLFSGMETSVFAAALAGALLALDRARRVVQGHARAEWRLGAWGVALVLSRPEAAVVVATFALVAARGSGPRSALATIARVAIPGALAASAVLALNWIFTGDPRHAGAQLKLLSSNPYLSEVDRARAYVETLVVLGKKVLRVELGATPWLAIVWPLCALVGSFAGGRRPVASACVISAVAWTLLVTWNGNAPFHNFRYYAPAFLLLAIAAALGIAAVGRRRRLAGAALAVLVVASAASRVPGQVRHFRAAVANVRDQHVEVGLRLRELDAASVVLVGDAGAIPYVSRKRAVDALGLGGYHTLPFARAAVHGEPAIVELVERIAPEARPTHLALYPNWFRTITSRFGREIDRVTIAENIIAGGPAKAIYEADWSTLDVDRPSTALDEIDVGDVVSEAAHAYASPAPRGGWTTLDVLTDEHGARRFDAGRIVPEGASESFVVHAEGTVRLRLRTDHAARAARARTSRGSVDLAFSTNEGGAWRQATATISVARGERIFVDAVKGDLHDFHVWIER